MAGKKTRAGKAGRSARKRRAPINREIAQTPQGTDSLYRELMNTLQVGLLIQGPDTRVLLSNPKALELLGLSEEQLLGRSALDPNWNIIQEDGSPFPGQNLPVLRAAATLQPVRDVVMGVHRPRTNDRVWLLVNATPHLKADGTLRQVIVSFADISAQKSAEHALRDKEERLRLALQGGDLGLWDWNVASGQAVVNQRWLSMYGLDP